MLVVLDTNVVFSGLLSSAGASHEILRMALREDIEVAISNTLYLEYEEVLTKPANLRTLDLASHEVLAVLDALVGVAKKRKVYYQLRPHLPDESDRMLVECAWVSHAEAIVTHNARHFPEGDLWGCSFAVTTPRDLLKEIRRANEPEE